MLKLTEGTPAPDFSLPADNQDGNVTLQDFAGQKLVIFFYPKDDTPGCTKESCSFRDYKAYFESAGAAVIGVSKNSLKDHEKFRAKYKLNFPLLSDENGHMCEDYGVWTEKSMYGRKYMGIERSTFLIDETGTLLKCWYNVKVPGHVEEVLEIAQSMSAAA